jgi:hypothetical protein
MKNKQDMDLVYFGKSKVWKIYPDEKADAIQPRWWHKLLFWKKWNYAEWKIRNEYKSLEEMLDDVAGKTK